MYMYYIKMYMHICGRVCVFIGERDDGVYVFEGDAENLWCVCVCVWMGPWHGVSMCVELRHFKYKWRSKGVCVFVGQRDGGVSEGDTE